MNLISKKGSGITNKGIGKSLFWKLLERFGVQGVQFFLQIILARLLNPEHYGVLSLMMIFVSLANVFIQNGFSTALIQDKEVKDEDYSSVFWVSMGVATFIYIIIFAFSPYIADFYGMPGIVAPLRVIAIMLFPGALNSIQLAKVSREMDFKKVFYSNVGAILVAGIIGIVIALLGGGIWALVAQTMLNVVIACAVMFFTVKWRPKFVCNFNRIKKLFSFGWKLLLSSLIDTFYTELQSLVIGKKYDSGMLGYFNRGKQFPQFISTAINGTVQSVMLPAMSIEQDDLERVKVLTRSSIVLSSYIFFPMMAGLAGVAAPLVSLILTDKWLPCVPFMQINCFAFAFYPVHSCNLQAINALGRSDIFLKLEIIKKGYALLILLIAVFCFDSPLAIAMTGIVSTVISCFVNASPNKKLIGYSYVEQMKDIFPSFIISLMMFVIVLCIGRLGFCVIGTLISQILIGCLTYIFFSVIFKLKPFLMLIELLQRNKEFKKNI